MKEIFGLRILGLSVFSFLFGVVGQKIFGNLILLFLVPMVVLWLISYDIKSFDYKSKKKSS